MTVLRLDANLRVMLPAAGTAPTALRRNPLFPFGTFHRSDFPGGSITFDLAFFRALVANFQKAGRSLPIDYFHRGDSYPDGQATDDKVAAGWIVGLSIEGDGTQEGDGLWMDNTWTERASKYILSDELRFISPTFATDAKDRSTGKSQGPTLYGAALLNDPFLEALPRVAASAVPPEAAKPAAPGARMDKALICAELGLPVETPDEEVMKQLAARVGKAKELAANTDKLSLAHGESVKALTAAQVAMAQQAEQLQKLTARMAEMEAKEKEATITALCRGLVSEGRIVAAQQDAVKAYALAMGVDKAKEFFGALPQVVKLGEAGIPGASTDVDETKTVQAQLDARVKELRAADPELSFLSAHAAALAEKPEWKNVLYAPRPMSVANDTPKGAA